MSSDDVSARALYADQSSHLKSPMWTVFVDASVVNLGKEATCIVYVDMQTPEVFSTHLAGPIEKP